MGAPLSIAEALARYETADPSLRVNHLGIPKSHLHSFSAYCTEICPEGNRGGPVFLNPYAGVFSRNGDEFSISHTIIDIHRRLAAEDGAIDRGDQSAGARHYLSHWPHPLVAPARSDLRSIMESGSIFGLAH